MNSPIRLNEIGTRLYAVTLHNHDYLWFSSFEISKVAATIPALHGYALSYAASQYSYGIFFEGGPRYESDLNAMPVYATPARPLGRPTLTRFTQNAINSVTLRTDDAMSGINSPGLGYKLVIDPAVPRSADPGERCGFHFYAFVHREQYQLPSIIRLGKKNCPVRLTSEELKNPVALRTEETVRPTHAVNPLDVAGTIKAFDPVPMPPHLVLRMADIEDDWFVFSGRHTVHVPRRFTNPQSSELAPVPTEPLKRARRPRA